MQKLLQAVNLERAKVSSQGMENRKSAVNSMQNVVPDANVAHEKIGAQGVENSQNCQNSRNFFETSEFRVIRPTRNLAK